MPLSKTNSANSRSSGNLSVFLLCLSAAALFWLLKSLSGTYVFHAPIPYALHNPPVNKILRSPAAGILHFELICNGFNHVSYSYFREFDTLLLRSESAIADPERLIFTEALLSAAARNALPGKFTIQSISTDTLSFRTESLLRKKLKVKPAINFEIDPDYVLRKPLAVEPASVQITGPKSRLSDIRFISTPDTTLGILHQPLSFTIKLNLPPEVSSTDSLVRISITPEKLVTRVLKLAIPPSEGRLRVSVDSVEVTIKVPLSAIDATLPAKINLGIKPIGGQQAEILVFEKPDYLRVVKLMPDKTTLLPVGR